MNVLVTAGPTREAIDPIRFLSNRSTGKMGFAVAASAAERGHTVRLIAGPVALAAPDRVERFDVVSAEEMCCAVEQQVDWCDVLVMTAAVADWRPIDVKDRKLKKEAMPGTLQLERTRDILTTIRPLKGDRIFVGFAAETEELVLRARRKLEEKGLDLIVANDASQADAAFEADTNRVVILGADGSEEPLPLLLKCDVALRLVVRVERLLCST